MNRKDSRTLTILERWVNGEISTAQGDRELKVIGVKLPKPSVKLNEGNIG